MGEEKYSQKLLNIITDSLEAGVYPTGSPIPSVRSLAEKFDTNRNTIYTIYKKLESTGYIYSKKGKGFFVAERIEKKESWEQVVAKSIEPLLLTTKMMGISEERLINSITDLIKEKYNKQTIRIAFVECNLLETIAIAENIERQINLKVTPLVLEDIHANSSLINNFDLVLTTTFHITEVDPSLSKNQKLIGLHHSPSPETISQISRIQKSKRIGIIATNERTLNILKGIVLMYHQEIKSIATKDQQDPEKIKHVIDNSDFVVINPEAYNHLKTHKSSVNFILVNFQIEKFSIDDIQKQIGVFESQIKMLV